jgi:predicted amino acid-binding ACT domain protein
MSVDISWRQMEQLPSEEEGFRPLAMSMERLAGDGMFRFYQMQVLLADLTIVRAKYFYIRNEWEIENLDITSEKMLGWRPDPKAHGISETKDVNVEDDEIAQLINAHKRRLESCASTYENRPLFHFTGSIDNVIGILREGFNHRVSHERLPLKGSGGGSLQDILLQIGGINTHLLPAIVCFCDMDIHEMSAHRQQYGGYAIGVTKEWARNNGVTPARYVHEKSPDLTDPAFYEASSLYQMIGAGIMPSQVLCNKFQANIGEITAELSAVLSQLDATIADMSRYILNNMFLMKQYEGIWRDRITSLPTKRVFYDEREWRSVSIGAVENNMTMMWSDVTTILIQEEAVEEISRMIFKSASELRISTMSDVSSKIVKMNDYLLER